jgi:glucosamine--fructose-6-phosphate aminotransferase (isomerizing)
MTAASEALPSLMIREIAESGEAIARQLAANADATKRCAAEVRARDPRLVATIARGSSDHCALYLKYLLEILLGVPCASIGPSIASLYNARLKLDGSLALSISQSGRSPDIVAMQDAAKRAGAFTFALVNDVSSPLATRADVLLPLHAGPEKSVAATKSMIATLVAGAALIAEWREDAALRAAIAKLPALLSAQNEPPPDALVARVAAAKSAFVLGRGATFAMAAEAALKLKETCAIHAEAFSSAEVLHGPAGIIAPGFLMIAFLPQDEAREGMNETLRRLQGMGAETIIIDALDKDGSMALAAARADHPQLTPIAMIHRFYRLAEACARQLGRDPDNPPHLRKVTETR